MFRYCFVKIMEKECIYGLLESVKTVWCHKVIKFELTIAVIDTLTEDGHARFWSVVYDKEYKSVRSIHFYC